MPNKSPHELARVRAIEQYAANGVIPGYEHLIEAAKADGKSTPADLAMAIIREIQAEPRATHQTEARGRSGFIDVQAVEAAASRAWESSPAIRAEFCDQKAAFVALKRAEALGQVRVPTAAR